jgi:CubicO group peptidase (beta-lactamase class C family)
MFENEKLMGKLVTGEITPEAALYELHSTRAASSKGVVIGSIIAIHRPEGQKVYTAGFADWDNNNAIRGNDIIRMYSVTKTFTAAITHQLCREGKLSLETKVSDILEEIKERNIQEGHPEFNLALEHLQLDKRVTVNDLLLHRSGAGTYLVNLQKGQISKQETFYDIFASNKKTHFDRYGNPVDQYGYFRYSDTNYNLQALIATHLVNQRLDPANPDRNILIKAGEEGFQNFHAIVKNRLLQPYGLSNTDFAAITRSRLEAGSHRMAFGYGTKSYNNAQSELYSYEEVTKRPPSLDMNAAPLMVNAYSPGAAAGLFSTAGDLCKWVEVLDSEYGQAIRGETGLIPQERPEAPSPSYVPGSHYGRGAILCTVDNVDLIGHTGHHVGHHTRAFYNPANKTAVVITETFENITLDIAKELIKSTSSFKYAGAAERENLLELDRHVALTIRDAYSTHGKYDRNAMLAEYKTCLSALQAGKQRSGTRFDGVIGQLEERLKSRESWVQRAVQRQAMVSRL